MRVGACHICGKELRGNINFNRNVQCWVCSERRAKYYDRVRMEEEARDRAMGIVPKHAKFGAARALGGKKSRRPVRGQG